jgi:hypothetical protein
MTDDQIEQIVDATSPPPQGGRWSAAFDDYRTWYATTKMGKITGLHTTVGSLILAVAVMAAGYPLVINSIGATNRAVVSRALEQSNYTSQVLVFNQAVAAYQICVDGVGRSDDNRGQWLVLTGILDRLDSAAQYADELRDGPLLSSPPRSIDDCPPPGDPPTPPK